MLPVAVLNCIAGLEGKGPGPGVNVHVYPPVEEIGVPLDPKGAVKEYSISSKSASAALWE